jgi:hypothetical protein
MCNLQGLKRHKINKWMEVFVGYCSGNHQSPFPDFFSWIWKATETIKRLRTTFWSRWSGFN